MKRLGWVILFVLALGYLLWPYQAVEKFARAVENQDAETITAMTDKTALRESLEKLIIESAVLHVREKRGRAMDEATVRELARQRVDTPAMQRQIDAGMEVESLRARLAAGPKLEKGGTVWTDEKWHSPWEFSVADRQGGRLFFRFTGLGWKYCGLEFTKAELQRLTAAQAR